MRITQLTANKYHRLYRYLKEYTTERYKKDDLPLTAVDYAYIDGLNTFMQTAHDCKNNGAVNLLCCLKNFMLYALRNEWIEKNPFQHYKMKPEHNKDKDHLTKAELETLIRKEMPNDWSASGMCSHSAALQVWPLRMPTTCARSILARTPTGRCGFTNRERKRPL